MDHTKLLNLLEGPGVVFLQRLVCVMTLDELVATWGRDFTASCKGLLPSLFRDLFIFSLLLGKFPNPEVPGTLYCKNN